MRNIDWVSKLTSRKFWMALTGFISGLLIALHMDEQTVTQISGIIMAGAQVVAYIIGEGLADAASAGGDFYEGDMYFGKDEEEKKEEE